MRLDETFAIIKILWTPKCCVGTVPALFPAVSVPGESGKGPREHGEERVIYEAEAFCRFEFAH